MEENKKIILPNNPYARATDFSPIVRILPKIGKNSICPLEGKKFKYCCGNTGQDFCSKAKDNLENFLNELKENKNVKDS